MMRIGGINSPLEATRFGETPKIQKKAVEASKNAMTDSYIEQLKEYARKDAQKGIYEIKKTKKQIEKKTKTKQILFQQLNRLRSQRSNTNLSTDRMKITHSVQK